MYRRPSLAEKVTDENSKVNQKKKRAQRKTLEDFIDFTSRTFFMILLQNGRKINFKTRFFADFP